MLFLRSDSNTSTTCATPTSSTSDITTMAMTNHSKLIAYIEGWITKPQTKQPEQHCSNFTTPGFSQGGNFTRQI